MSPQRLLLLEAAPAGLADVSLGPKMGSDVSLEQSEVPEAAVAVRAEELSPAGDAAAVLGRDVGGEHPGVEEGRPALLAAEGRRLRAVRATDVGAQVVAHAEVHAAELAGEEDVVRVAGVGLNVAEEGGLRLGLRAAHQAGESTLRVLRADVRAEGLAARKLQVAVETPHGQGPDVRPHRVLPGGAEYSGRDGRHGGRGGRLLLLLLLLLLVVVVVIVVVVIGTVARVVLAS